MMTISLAGSIPLLPALALHASQPIATGWFLVVAGLMLIEHIRRTKLLNLGSLLAITWVLYRLAVLPTLRFFS